MLPDHNEGLALVPAMTHLKYSADKAFITSGFERLFKTTIRLAVLLTTLGHVQFLAQTDSPKNFAVPRLIVQTGHSDEVVLVALSRDGRLALTAGDTVSTKDYSICLWEVATGREIRRLTGHTGHLRSLAFSRDGRFAASASQDKTARLWNLETGEEVRRMDHPDWAHSVAFSPDGRYLATGSASYIGVKKPTSAFLWETETGKLIRTFEGHQASIYGVAFSRDGETLATGSADGTARTWNVASAQSLREFKEQKLPVLSIAFSSDGKSLAVGSGDKTVRIYDAQSGKVIKKFDCISGVRTIALTPDNKYLATGGDYPDEKIHLWNLETGTEERQFEGSNHAVFSSDGKQILTAAPAMDALFASLWDVGNGKLRQRFSGRLLRVHDIDISPDGNYLTTVNVLGRCHLWNLQTGSPLLIEENFDANNGRSFSINQAILDSGGNLITAESDDLLSGDGGGIQFWNVKTGDKVRRIDTGGMGAIASSRDGRIVAAGRGNILSTSTDFSAHVYTSATGKEAHKLGPHTGTVGQISFSADGQLLLTGTDSPTGAFDDAPRLWDVKSGNELQRFASSKMREQRAGSIALSPDGRWVATANVTLDDENVSLLWNARTGSEVFTLKSQGAVKGFAGQINSLAFSSDDSLLATASNDRTLRLWDVATGKELKRFDGHTDTAESVKFALNDRYLISAADDGTVRFWSVATGSEICRLVSFDVDHSMPDARDVWVVIAPDGRFDANSLDKIDGLHWGLPDSPFRPLPLEMFLRDYYEPQLLPRLLKCDAAKNCAEEFKPVRNLSTLNRAQPEVRITNVTAPDKDHIINVTVEVGSGETEVLSNGKLVKQRTGAFDLRLFRNGQLVGYHTNNVSLPNSTAELQQWRTTTEIKLDANNKRSFVFPVKIPFYQYSSQTLSAYAFNEDRVKSETVRWEKAEAKATSTSGLLPSRRAYIISVGVNASQIPHLELQYAANDARKFQTKFGDALNQTSQTGIDVKAYSDADSRRFARQENYYEVVAVPLIADDVQDAGGKTLAVRDATKSRIKATIDLVAGKTVEETLKKSIPNFDRISKATPDDLVLISFSSHGYADPRGAFYLFPYDVQAGKDGAVDLRSAISSDELSLWLRDVDAAEIVMIIDACYAAALTGTAFKAAPLGSRGLGQLAYDKGMRVLAATQADNVAFEFDQLQQGLLTYALIQDGLHNKQAKPVALGKLITDVIGPNVTGPLFKTPGAPAPAYPMRPTSIVELLKYATRRVPELYEEIRDGKRGVQINGRLAETKARAELVGIVQSGGLQQPVLLDFGSPTRSSLLIASPETYPQ